MDELGGATSALEQRFLCVDIFLLLCGLLCHPEDVQVSALRHSLMRRINLRSVTLPVGVVPDSLLPSHT